MPHKAVKSQSKLPEKEVEKWTPFDHPHYVQFNAPVDAWGARLLNDSVKPHVDSFNLFTNEILGLLPDDISPAEMTWHDGTTVRCWLSDLSLHQPIRGEDVLDPRLLPTHCRQAHITYSGELSATVNVSLGTGEPPVQMARVPLGLVPIMVRSEACHLHGMPPSKMVQCGEDPDERGGYFIVNGNEKVIRLLIMPKSNFPVALYRPSFSNRGPLYSAYAVQMRSMRPDLTTQTVTMHYRKDGTCWVRFTYLKNEYLIPLMLLLKCLAPDELNSERSLFELLCDGLMADTFVAERVTCMLEQMRTHPELKHVHSREDALYYLGSKFEVVFREKRGAGVSLDGIALEVDDAAMSPVEKSVSVARRLLDSLMLVHCPKGAEGGKAKVDCLVLIFRKLMALVRGDIAPDNADAMDVQELLLPGQLFGALLKEVLQSSLLRLEGALAKKSRQAQVGKGRAPTVLSAELIRNTFMGVCDVTKRMESFLATGNITSRSGLDLQQTTGFTVVADKLNAYRYLSHFRAVHRGSFFQEMKTTSVRKLLPETWGFLCPVHTPDGTPCGLLNHLAAPCQPVVRIASPEGVIPGLEEELASLGVQLVRSSKTSTANYGAGENAYVTLDGRVLGKVARSRLEAVAEELRRLKIDKDCPGVPADLEIVACQTPASFEGLWLFTGPCRMVRPVRDLATGNEELVGPMEQVFLKIAATREDLEASTKTSSVPENIPMKYTHIELSPISMLSVIAGLTPFSNHNQSPRNMYQCQMLKQTMAIPYLNHPYRTDNKVYKITYPQFPMVRTTVLSEANFDVKPAGTNAIVAVIAHSGFDMEDALIISKGSYDRGFKHGSVYKTKVINCPPKGTVGSRLAQFRADNHSVKGEKVVKDLDYDGIPYIGQQVHEGDPICRVLNKGTGEAKLEKYKEGEVAWVEQVNMIGGGGWWGGGAGARNPGGIKDGSERMSIKLRLPRNPVVGDKFSSRHGQKGVMAILWPQADMPFSGTSGISPDIMFNPHGMPSRMTIGMLIEFMAGKAAALTGMPVVNANSFRQYRGKGLLDTEHNNEKDPYAPGDTTAHEYFGETLKKFGYEYLGAEELYSGMHGEPLKTHIYMGVVYYQRLRHMVLDKFQVRATGPIDPLTRQPVKGRKKHGGVRFGEMERDSLISHGTSALLADRLLKCSDACEDWVCPECGSILSYAHSPETVKRYSGREAAAQAPICRACSTERGIEVRCAAVTLPYVFRYMSAEFASMNIRLRLRVKEDY